MLLDEPTSALDPELVGEVLSVIRDLADGGMTMIMATHQMDFAQALATEILFMEQGRIIEQGLPSELWPRVPGPVPVIFADVFFPCVPRRNQRSVNC